MATCEFDPAEVERARRALEDCLKPKEWRKINHFDDNRAHGKDVVQEARDFQFLWDLAKVHPGVVKLASLCAKECDEVLKVACGPCPFAGAGQDNSTIKFVAWCEKHFADLTVRQARSPCP